VNGGPLSGSVAAPLNGDYWALSVRWSKRFWTAAIATIAADRDAHAAGAW